MGGITTSPGHLPVEVALADPRPQARAVGEGIASGGPQIHHQEFLRPARLIPPDAQGTATGGDHQVLVAITVQIADGDTPGRGRRAGEGRNRESAGSIVEIELVRQSEGAARDEVLGVVEDVAVGDHQIQIPVPFRIDDADTPAHHLGGGKTEPAAQAEIVEEATAGIHVQAIGLLLKVGQEDGGTAGAGEVGGGHSHAPLRVAGGAVADPRLRRGLHQPPPLVEVEEVEGAIVGDVGVRSSVTIEIRHPDAHAPPLGLHSGLPGHIREAPAVVAVEAVRRGRKLLRAAVDLKVASLAGLFLLRVVAQVVDDVEIQVAVPVIVQERPADAPGRVLGAHRDPLETPGAVVPEKDVGAVVQHVEIQIAIPIPVADGHPHAVAVVASAGGLRPVFEGAVTAVAVEAVAGSFPGLVPGQRTAVNHIEIQVVVTVRVEKGNAGAHGLHVVVEAGGAVVVLEGHP